MKRMKYLCRAERQVRMTAVAIKPERQHKNECPIEGHPFLPNNKPGFLPFHLAGMCKWKQEGIEKVSYVSVWRRHKRKLFQKTFQQVSILSANETKKRLLKSGKDILKSGKDNQQCDFANQQCGFAKPHCNFTKPHC